MTGLFQDVRYALRQLRKSIGFTSVAVITLALGIGATTAIFTVANDFLFRPLPFGNAGQIVMVKRYDPELAHSGWADRPTFRYWREQNRVFEEMAAWSEARDQYNLTGAEGPERVPGKQVSSGFFRVLGVETVLGRTFSAADDQPGGERNAIISHALWQKRYGGATDVVGKRMVLDGEGYTIVGVLPAGFRFSATSEDVWTPLDVLSNGGAGGFNLNVIALLRPEATVGQAQANLEALATQLGHELPDQWTGRQKVAVENLRDRYARQLRPALLTLLVAAALVLLIGCTNLSNLMLARAIARSKEIAVRRALGACRGRIIQQMLVEGSLLALLGGTVGLLTASVGVRVFYAALPAAWHPLALGGMDYRVLIFASTVSVLTVLFFGLTPALSGTGLDVNQVLKESPRSALPGSRRRLFRTVLAAGEVALATMLLAGTGLLLKSFIRLTAVNMGFRSENVLTVSLTRTRTGTDEFYNQVLERVTALPQVRAAGAINYAPLSGGVWGQDITLEGRPPRPRGDYIWASHRSVTIGYFRAMEIPLLKGRSFVATDWEQRVAMISETMARRYWPGEDPVGKRFGVNCFDTKCNWNTVVGVVGDVKELGPTGEPVTAMYFPETMPTMMLIVRAARDPILLGREITDIIHSIDPEQPVSTIESMEKTVSESESPQRLTTLIAGLFATLALVLATIGLYGVASHSVEQRRHEFGVRLALGARPRDITRMTVRQGMVVASAGLVAGIVGALSTTRLIQGLLFFVQPSDPSVLALAGLVSFAVSIVSVYFPARRASGFEPNVVLRYE